MTNQTLTASKPKYCRIRTVAGLRKLVREGNQDFFILLSFGITSSKNITEYDGKFHVLHEIDGTLGEYTAKELYDSSQTNIGKAMKNGTFFCRLPD